MYCQPAAAAMRNFKMALFTKPLKYLCRRQAYMCSTECPSSCQANYDCASCNSASSKINDKHHDYQSSHLSSLYDFIYDFSVLVFPHLHILAFAFLYFYFPYCIFQYSQFQRPDQFHIKQQQYRPRLHPKCRSQTKCMSYESRKHAIFLFPDLQGSNERIGDFKLHRYFHQSVILIRWGREGTLSCHLRH